MSSVNNKLQTIGKRKLEVKAPILAALSKPPLEVDLAVIGNQLLDLLTLQEFEALCKLAKLPFFILVPLIQVMNNPGVKESVAHLPVWKQVQFGFRQFCPIGTKWSARDKKVRSSIIRTGSSSLQWTPDQYILMESLSNRHRVWKLTWGWHTWYWDKGVKDGLWFIKSREINHMFLDCRGIRDPEEKNDIPTKEETDKVIFYNSASDLYLAVAYDEKVLDELEIQSLSKIEQFYYWAGVGYAKTNRRDYMPKYPSYVTITNPFESEYWLKKMEESAAIERSQFK